MLKDWVEKMDIIQVGNFISETETIEKMQLEMLGLKNTILE